MPMSHALCVMGPGKAPALTPVLPLAAAGWDELLRPGRPPRQSALLLLRQAPAPSHHPAANPGVSEPRLVAHAEEACGRSSGGPKRSQRAAVLRG